jgi:tripeptide aminopeptidase
MINDERLRETFLALVAFNSPTGKEAQIGEWCGARLRAAGLDTRRDEAGNWIAESPGQVPGQRIFFSGHLDTVAPTEGLRVVEDGDVFRTDGRTILGADDKAALAAILEAVAVLKERKIPHGPLQVVFTVAEETGLNGARALDPEAIRGALGFVLDASGPTGTLITAAPSHEILEVTYTGRAAHAGFCPETGVSALQAACRAVESMPLGRIDDETTANVGILQGGTANNIIPAEAYVKAEARSRDPEKLAAQVAAMTRAFDAGAAAYGASVVIKRNSCYQGYHFSPDDPPLALAAAALRRLGRVPAFRPTGGGSDASIWNARGIPTAVLTCGYMDAHAVTEHVSLADMRLAAEWVVAIVQEAAAGTRK